MAFIGNTVQTQGFTPATDTFSGNGSTTSFTLSRPVASVQQIEAVISNVVQDPNSAYTVSGNTITFTSAPPSGTNNIYVRYTSLITQTLAPGLGTVTPASLNPQNTLYWDTSNVGIGTTTPIRQLTVSSASSAEFVLQDRSRAANAKNMRFYNAAGVLTLGTLNDAGDNGTPYLNVNNSTGIITGNGRNLSPAIVPVGSVIQTQWNNFTVNYTGNSGSYVQVTAFNQTFTPLYASSKVYVTFNTGINLICDGNVALTRNGSIIKDTWFGSSRQDDQYDYPQASGFYLDSPGTTSTVTYGIQVRATGCGNIIRIGGSDNHQSFTFMEIAA